MEEPDQSFLQNVATHQNGRKDCGVPKRCKQESFAGGFSSRVEDFPEPHELRQDQGVDKGEAESFRVADLIASQHYLTVKGKNGQQEPEVNDGYRETS